MVFVVNAGWGDALWPASVHGCVRCLCTSSSACTALFHAHALCSPCGPPLKSCDKVGDARWPTPCAVPGVLCPGPCTRCACQALLVLVVPSQLHAFCLLPSCTQPQPCTQSPYHSRNAHALKTCIAPSPSLHRNYVALQRIRPWAKGQGDCPGWLCLMGTALAGS